MGIKISELTTTTATGTTLDAVEWEINNAGTTEKITRKKLLGNYKSYLCNLRTQSGTNAPTVDVLENTLSGTPVWTRTSQGNYDLTLASEFTQYKTFMYASQCPDVKLNVQWISANVVRLVTSDTTGGAEFPDDGLISDNSFEVRVYE